MKNEIITKLNSHVARGVTGEADVVYLFVQVGKLLEQGQSRAYPALEFYRNWVVHHKLERISSNPAMKDLLDKLEAAETARQSQADQNAVLALLSDTIGFRQLYDEMITFFRDTPGFDTAVFDRPEPWANLGALLLSILVDLPLLAPERDYRLIREFRFKPAVDDTHIARVAIRLASGEVLEGPIVTNKPTGK
ncbi:MAG: hypothetical protein Q8P35_01545 [Candidatus Yanofskybacteria bacterium]|nr:hypothetical protein [Candidatus Yanofskybacteria bacterium]